MLQSAYTVSYTHLKAFKNKGLERSFKMAVDSAVYDELAKELNNIGK